MSISEQGTLLYGAAYGVTCNAVNIKLLVSYPVQGMAPVMEMRLKKPAMGRWTLILYWQQALRRQLNAPLTYSDRVNMASR